MTFKTILDMGGAMINVALLTGLIAGCSVEVPENQTQEPEPAAGGPSSSDYVKELPLPSANASGVKAPIRRLSKAAAQMRALYQELDAFRFEPNFHVLGFAPGTNYGEWKGKVQLLGYRDGLALGRELGVVPGDLLMLGEDYQRDKGLNSDHSQTIAGKLNGRFYRQHASKSQGRLSQDSDGCSDFDKLAASIHANEEQKFTDGAQYMEEAQCRSLPEDTIVDVPTRRRQYIFQNGDTMNFVQLRARGDALWVEETAVVY